MSTKNNYDTNIPVLIMKVGWNALHHISLGAVRSLGRLGIPVYAVCEDSYTPTAVSKYLAGAFVWSQGSDPVETFLADLDAIGRSIGRQTILIPLDDLGAVLMAEHASSLRHRFIFPETNRDLPRMVADKSRLASLCEAMGHPHPRTFLVRGREDAARVLASQQFPLVLKRPEQWNGSGPTTMLVRESEQLLPLCDAAAESGTAFLLQEYIPRCDRQDWYFHAYCDGNSDCVASFTGIKIRSNPPHAGGTCLGESVDNAVLRSQAEAFLKALNYRGLLDLDYRFDIRDGTYKLLDFNPRLGAQFRVFQDEEGTDLVRALHLDLTGRRPQQQIRALSRRFMVEEQDAAASLRYMLAHELGIREWVRSLHRIGEFAWYAPDDLLPFVVLATRHVFGDLVLRRVLGRPRRAQPRRAPAFVPGRRGSSIFRRLRKPPSIPGAGVLEEHGARTVH